MTLTTPSIPIIFYENHLDTPLGKLTLWVTEQSILQYVGWSEFNEETLQQLKTYYGVKEIQIHSTPKKSLATQALQQYFAGTVSAIDHLSVAQFGTPFQQKVWQALRKIPVGTTTSYGELAIQIGNAKACRAVGMANNRNPIAIVVPCHRVIGKNNILTGYAGGLDRKQWLLDHEHLHSCALFNK